MFKFPFKIIAASLSFLLLVPVGMSAYQEATVGGNLVATIAPANPEPNTRVIISLRAYGIDIDNSLITWGINGKLVNSGFGLKNFAFQTGPLGSRTIISIDVMPRTQNSTIKKILVFEPMNIELNWQAATSRPYWYQGRSLVTPESLVQVSALAQAVDQKGRPIAPETLIYKWSKNDKILETQSGIGRSNLSYVTAKKGADQIGLTVLMPDGNTTTKSINVPVEAPQIAFYTEQALWGTVFQQQMGLEQPLTDNLALRAEVFGFSSDPLRFDWRLGQKTIFPKQDDPGLMYFAVKSNQPVNQRVDLSINNLVKNFQSAAGNIFLTNQSASGNF